MAASVQYLKGARAIRSACLKWKQQRSETATATRARQRRRLGEVSKREAGSCMTWWLIRGESQPRGLEDRWQPAGERVNRKTEQAT
eukprot:3991417-Amphidinium_carterae.1